MQSYYQQPNQGYGQPPFTPTPVKEKKTGLILGTACGVLVVGLIAVILLVTGVLGGGSKNQVLGTWHSASSMVEFDDDGNVHIATSDGTVLHIRYELLSSRAGVILAPESGPENAGALTEGEEQLNNSTQNYYGFANAEFSIDEGVLQIEGVIYYRNKEDIPK
jgi:hypothetical protein